MKLGPNNSSSHLEYLVPFVVKIFTHSLLTRTVFICFVFDSTYVLLCTESKCIDV
jgi:hypothetical protein